MTVTQTRSIDKDKEAPSMNGDKLITVNELSEILNVKINTIYRMVRNNVLPSHKFGRSIFFDREEIAGKVGESVMETSNKHSALAEISVDDDWSNLLFYAGFSRSHIKTLKTMGIDSFQELCQNLATRAGRVGLCAALQLTQKRLDEKMCALIANLD